MKQFVANDPEVSMRRRDRNAEEKPAERRSFDEKSEDKSDDDSDIYRPGDFGRMKSTNRPKTETPKPPAADSPLLKPTPTASPEPRTSGLNIRRPGSKKPPNADSPEGHTASTAPAVEDKPKPSVEAAGDSEKSPSGEGSGGGRGRLRIQRPLKT